MRARAFPAWVTLVLAGLTLASAAQSDTTTYRYDPLGRLTQVPATAGAGTTSSYTYDPADNRSNVTVTTGAANCAGVSFTIASNAAVTEGSNSIFTVTKAGGATGNCTVDYATSGGTATSGADYVAGSGTLVFTSAQTSQTVSVQTIDDTLVEGSEAFAMSLSGPSGGSTLGAQYSAAATINDNEPATNCSGVSFTIANPAPVTEGGSVVFTVTKAGTTSSSCSVNYATTNGSAQQPGDYNQGSGTLTFTSAQTSKTFAVTTTDDATIESTETFTASLSGPTSGATLGSPSSATANIVDDDSATYCAGVTFTISSNGAVTEGATSVLTVTKTGTATGTCLVNYKTVEGSATSADYTGTAGYLAFTQAQTTQTFSVATIDDTIPEASESFTGLLTFPSGGATLTNPEGAAATINDNDGGGGTSCSAVSFTIAPAAAVTEGGTSVFTVTKTGSTSASCSVNWTTVSGTAEWPGDFAYTTGTLTFTAAQTSKTLSVVTWDDTLAESGETYSVALSSPSSGATLGTPSSATGAINDNDSAPACTGVSFSIATPAAVTEGGSTVFTVTKTGTATGSCDVSYATANGTALAGSDYAGTTGTLTFLTGDTSKTFNVATTDDALVESAETYTASLSSPTGGATLGTPSSATATINDNDTAGPCNGVSFTIASNGAVTEGTNSAFTITKTGTATGSCNVNYATANGTATAGSDYTSASSTLTFTSAQTAQTVNVATTDDATGESAETFTMSLSSPTGGAALGTPSSATATINDNDGGGNQPPVANFDNAGSMTCNAFKTVNVVANDTDPEGNLPLTVVSASGSGGIIVTVVSSTSIQIESVTLGSKSFSYVVKDSLNAQSTGSGSVTVTGSCG